MLQLPEALTVRDGPDAAGVHGEHRWYGNLVTGTSSCGQERFLPFGKGLAASSCVGER